MKILLVDDHEIVRHGLRTLLESRPGAQVTEAADGRTAVRLAGEWSPDVVVMDVSMPDLNGIEATRMIKSRPNSPKVVALTAASGERVVHQLLDAGASAFINKTDAFAELGKAIDAVIAGERYLCPSVAKHIAGGRSDDKTAFDRLSTREREVLQLMAEGKATKEVAAHLHVSVKTIETHRKHLMEKLNLFSVAELTKYAIREGLTAVERRVERFEIRD